MTHTVRSKQIMKAFGERLRKIRIDANFSEAEEFARALGLERMRYNYYELGERFPPPDVLERIVLITRQDLSWLILGKTTDKKRS